MVHVRISRRTDLLVRYASRPYLQIPVLGDISHLAILIMRLYIMYRCNRTFLITLCTLFVAELTIEIVIMAEVIYGLQGCVHDSIC